MTLEKILLAVVTGVLVAECCSVCEWTALRLVGWAVRLSYGDAPKGDIRHVEHVGDVFRCRIQTAKLGYALGLLMRGVFEWVGRLTGWSRAGRCMGDRASYYYRAAAESLAVALSGIDIRAASPRRRTEIGRLTTQLGSLLQRPPDALDRESAAVLLATTASVCEAYISDRNEELACSLAEAARPHLTRLGLSHPAALSVRRAYAYALVQLGRSREAEVLLRSLREQEAQIFGARDPHTFRTWHLHCWALAGLGRFEEAEAGLGAIEARLADLQMPDMSLLRHVQCKRSWVLGQLRRIRESAVGYDYVIANRSQERGCDDPDTLDARHSQGKMLVQAGQAGTAFGVLLPLLADRKRVEGPDHPDTLETGKFLAVARALMRPQDTRTRRRTVRELRRLARMQARRHGSDHPHTRDTRQWLAMVADVKEN
jgi:hypothetical protein